jgi:hypothetical protein
MPRTAGTGASLDLLVGLLLLLAHAHVGVSRGDKHENGQERREMLWGQGSGHGNSSLLAQFHAGTPGQLAQGPWWAGDRREMGAAADHLPSSQRIC